MRDVVTHWLTDERSVLIAWLILVAVNLLLGLSISDDSPLILWQGFRSRGFLEAGLATAVVYAYLVLVVRYIRGPERRPRAGLPSRGGRLGPWGYIWRSYVVLLLVLLPLMARTMSYLNVGRSAPPPPGWSLIFLLLVGAPFVAWLVFGRNRMSLVNRLRGSKDQMSS